jgi:transposase-like protein
MEDMMSAQPAITRSSRWKHYTTLQRLAILREWELPETRLAAVSERYGISPTTLCRWKKRLRKTGEEFLEEDLSELSLKVGELERENQMLKNTMTSGNLPELNLRVGELEKENQILKDTVISLSKDLTLLKKKINHV